MPPPRPYWKGYLKLSLVSCPISVYSATSAGERVAFRQINKQTGNRLRQQLVDDETGDVVEAADKGRGYEIAKHEYLQIEDDELNAIAIESSHTIDIDSFVPRAQIDERYLDSPYYLIPEGKVAQDAFAVIRDAMRGKDMVALGRIVMAKRERVVMLQAWERGIMATSLRYAYEVRDTKSFFDEIPEITVPADMLKLAEHILDSKAATFEPMDFKDRYEDAVLAMLKTKQAGGSLSKDRLKSAGPNVINLMEALKRSLEGVPRPKDMLKPKTKARNRVAGQGEMLLPIAGKKQAAKPAETKQTTPKVKGVSVGRRTSSDSREALREEKKRG